MLGSTRILFLRKDYFLPQHRNTSRRCHPKLYPVRSGLENDNLNILADPDGFTRSTP